MKRKRQWLSSLSAFLLIPLLMVNYILPTHSLRRIQNAPYQPWDLNDREYEYVDLEDDDVIPVPSPVLPQQQQQQQAPYQRNRPPSRHRNFNAAPRPVPFGGEFHISRDRFVPFVASDVVMDKPTTSNSRPIANPKPKALPFVPGTNSAFTPETTSEPAFVYYTPSTLYITTRSPAVGQKPETFVERKRQKFYSNNETESFVVTGHRPGQDSSSGNSWRNPADSNAFNKLTATSVQPPVTDLSQELTTSQFFDLQRTFKPNTIYPYPTDRIRSGSEYRPSDHVIRQNSRNNLNFGGEVTERAIVTSSQPVTDDPYQEKRRLSTGAIAGIAIGILAPLALVAGALSLLLRLCLHKRRGIFVLWTALQNSRSQRGG